MKSRLTILHTFRKAVPNDYVRTMAHVRCQCGVEFDAVLKNVQNGNTRSCGCIRSELAKENLKKMNRRWETA